MELTFGQEIGLLSLLSISAVAIRWWFFLPYQNKFMCWYMKKYSRKYRMAKLLFNEMLDKQQECSAGTVSTQDGYLHFLAYLHGDKRFVSIEDTRQKFHEVMTLEEIIDYGGEPERMLEAFTCFVGKGRKTHRISILFANESSIYLESIELAYQDEGRDGGFLHLIEKKHFPKGGDGGRSSAPNPTPVLEFC